MKKIMMFLVILCLVCNVSAVAPLVVDNAGLLSSQEILDLTEQLEYIRDTLAIDVVVLTENSADTDDIAAYADDYYDYNGYSENGVLLLLDMERREWWISTCGTCIIHVDADEIGNNIVPLLSEGSYYKAFSYYGELVETAMDPDSIPGEVITATGNVSNWFDGIGRSIMIGIVVGGIVVAVMAGGMKSVRAQNSASNYVKDGSLQLSCREDRYLYQSVTKRPKPKNNSSSGGSYRSSSGRSSGGSHRSSSGRSHGGGGGRF